MTKAELQRWLGEKTGAALFAHARGWDDRKPEMDVQRKSIGADVNWHVLRARTSIVFEMYLSLAFFP
jgi:nucleotidyltransferase/DNA polymerase involved in DNA repair